MIIDADWIRELIEAAGYEARTDYNGRGMHGRTCVGCVTDGTVLDTLADLAEYADSADEVSLLVRHCHHDRMGKGLILYWPQYPTDPSRSSEDDDQ